MGDAASLPQNRDRLAGIMEISANIAERQRAQAELLESKRFLRSTLDTLSSHIAIINERGVVIDINAAWKKFTKENQFIGCDCGLGGNYLAICDSASGNLAAEARTIADSIRAVMAGRSQEFQLEYASHSPAEQRWFVVRATRFAGDGLVRVVVAHENITDRKLAEMELAQTREQLSQASRHAVMAEAATGVLHNVGNVLNSVSVSATVVADRLRRSKLTNLCRVAGVMREQNGRLAEYLTADPKGKLIPEYIATVANQLAGEQAKLIEKMDSVGQHIEHIKEIVAMQQSYARVSGVYEDLSAAGLVEDALRMNAAAFDRHGIELVREFAENLPLVLVDRHKVLQILINLLRNAKYAMDAQPGHEKRLRVRVEMAWPDKVRIIIADNGIGIGSDHLTKIFNHGFTTKKDGHGFGLHSGANAAKEMGGQLSARSDGPGKGAEFTLELPAVATVAGNGPSNAQ